MKTNHSLKQLKPAWRPRLAACAAAALALCGTVSAFDPNATCPAVTNTLSKFPVIIDGRFTNGVDEGGKLQGEWSDITPQAFLLDPSGRRGRCGRARPMRSEERRVGKEC